MKIHISIVLLFSLIIVACKNENKSSEKTEDNTKAEQMKSEIPWHANATIYELNTRHFSKEGTLKEVTRQIERLDDLGIDILWLMPIHPIGLKNRKGELGSPYSILDFKQINPDLGTKEDLKELINAAHSVGIKVIIDWVANHTSWDATWTKTNPEFYTLVDGKMSVPLDNDGNLTDWTDVADLNYDNKELWTAMTDAMKYWIEEFDLDGFRCDMAGMVPLEFWVQNRKELEALKPLFMLAEWDDPAYHKAFEMSYAWPQHHIFNDIAKGGKRFEHLRKWYDEETSKYQKKDYRLSFVTNHDENAWQGTIKERMGKNADALTVVSFTFYGMPLIYSGQEVGMDKRLSFFGKDEIDWSDLSKSEFYGKLIKLKEKNSAIWNGIYGGQPEILLSSGGRFVYKRQKNDDKVVVLINVHDVEKSFKIEEKLDGMYDAFTNEQYILPDDGSILVPAHGYLVLSTVKN
jgi:glycosidase